MQSAADTSFLSTSVRDRPVVAQVFEGPGRTLTWKTCIAPERLGPLEMLVQIDLATICGSDLHTLSGHRREPVPCILGHEAVGRVVAVGEGRTGFVPGDRVTWSIADSCGTCPACTGHRLPQKCESLFKYGHASLSDGSGLNGCYASHILLRSGTHAVKVPDILPDAVVAPANCALATMVNLTESLPFSCHTAVVQGAGLLGLYGCALLKEAGVEKVFCVDVSEDRLENVAAFGATPIDGNDESHREKILRSCRGAVDAVFEVAGVSSVIPDGMALLRPGGLYGWAGMVHPDTRVYMTGEQVIRKCLTIRGIHNYAPWHLDAAVSFLERTIQNYPYASLTSEPYPLTELPSAFEAAQTRKWARVSVKP